MKKFLLIFCAILVSTASSVGDEIFSGKETVVWGITQGATEFLPISSTGHMLLVDKFLLNGERGGRAAGDELKLTAKGSYFSIIQFGSILAVLCMYRRRFGSLILGVIGKDCRGRRMAFSLGISFFPAAAVGILIDGWLQKLSYNEITVAAALVVGGVIMLFAERAYDRKFPKGAAKIYATMESLTTKQSLTIGLWQCLAFIPGMSRSMTTIVGGYRCGLRRSEAAEYSFLLGSIVLSAATVYKFIKDFDVIFLCFTLKTFLLGIFTAFVTSLATIKLFTVLIARHGTSIFAWYRIILAAIIFANLLT
ncbi:MAG: undecaprenyl-diphosphate phosphatase [Puniceicoccales bacterium]|jgi:undecaprenyl-diphosphatase|nr:undecaprenyl-diphosphate phosphatase [Puniceicoccales bacterium]